MSVFGLSFVGTSLADILVLLNGLCISTDGLEDYWGYIGYYF